MKILLIEDDHAIGSALLSHLKIMNHAVDWVQSKAHAFEAILNKQAPYDLILVDIGLPDGKGLEVIKYLRDKDNKVPIIVVSAYDKIKNKLEGLDQGADDYITKPFDIDELDARIRALTRRAKGVTSPILRLNDIVLDPARQSVKHLGNEISIGPKEFAILKILMEKPGHIFSKSKLENKLYDWDSEVLSNTIEVHIHGLRKVLGKDMIKTIRNVGYKIDDQQNINNSD